jgi:hypothetical protein
MLATFINQNGLYGIKLTASPTTATDCVRHFRKISRVLDVDSMTVTYELGIHPTVLDISTFQ